MKTLLDLVNDCDDFPYAEKDAKAYEALVSSYYQLHLLGREGTSGPHGFMPQWVIEKMPWNGQWEIDEVKRTITPKKAGGRAVSQNAIFAETLLRARESKSFQILDGWRDEIYPIFGHQSDTERDISMERSGSALFGFNTYGVHMTIYTMTGAGLKVWVPRRSRTKQTYSGMLDNSVAGGLATGEIPFEGLIREASEEASIPESLVRSNAKACGTVSYVHIRDERAGGESGLLQPECQFVYDMEVGEDVIPRPHDTEVEAFYLWKVDEVTNHLLKGDFKPNCALVLLDWLIRHGCVTAEDEPNYVEIVSRLHREMPFPSR